MILTISKPIAEYTHDTYLEYIKTLRIKSDAQLKASRSVPEITLIFNKTPLVRINRPFKEVSLVEFHMLVNEYVREPDELWKLLTKRQVMIFDSESGEILNAKYQFPRSSRTKGRAKADAVDIDHTPGQDEGDDQLLKLGSDSDLPKES